MAGIGHNEFGGAEGLKRIKAAIKEVESIDDQIGDLQEDQKAYFEGLKGAGVPIKELKVVLKLRQAARKDPEKLKVHLDTVDLLVNAIDPKLAALISG